MPRLSFIKTNVVPPDGFRYRFPQTGYVVHAWDYDTWVQNARNHCRANNMKEPPDLAALMEEQLCLLLPPGWCNYDDDRRPRPNLTMDWNDIKSGLATFTRWIKDGANYVPQAEAERRALICSRCYLNLPVAGCAACQAAVDKIVRNKMTKHDSYLRACGVCKCLLRAKVHFPLSNLDKNDPGAQALYPDFCWLKKGGANNRG